MASIYGLLFAFSWLGFAKTRSSVSLEEYARIRCATDGRDVYVQWEGKIYSSIPNEKQKHLFDMVGLNVARCTLRKESEKPYVEFVSRELNYYLDPETGELIHSWENPWSLDKVVVVHAANNPVQHKVDKVSHFSVLRSGRLITLSFDVPLTYPNPLGGDITMKDYSPSPLYQAVEIFKYTAIEDEVRDSKLRSVRDVHISWTRQGPWLPWMKMGNRSGYLIYSASGAKISFDDINPIIKAELKDLVPLYSKAPLCYQPGGNQTSWTYFKKHFLSYKAGRPFPVPAPLVEDSCDFSD